MAPPDSSQNVAKGADELLGQPKSADEGANRRNQIEYKSDTMFELPSRLYQQQFGDMYFLRLAVLKPIVEARASEEWDGLDVEGEKVHRVERVLDVRQGEICWVAGTVYMEMPLKPNVLEDIAKDHFISAPPIRNKYRDFKNDEIMLEDESGRLKLVGPNIAGEMLVTGCVIAVMGTENASGEFEVVGITYPDLPPQAERPKATEGSRIVALASGLSISGGVHESLQTHLFTEFITGELAASEDQKRTATISHLFLAGNSLGGTERASEPDDGKVKQAKKYGYDSTAYNAKPTEELDALIADLCSSISVIMMPGDHDPANYSLPQQPIHAAIFPTAKSFLESSLFMATNPYACELNGVRLLGTSGQTISDIYKYVDGEDRLDMMERTLRWRHVAPTCPDTLWCYPFQDSDQFVLDECPHVYFAGNQPKFATRIIEGDKGQFVRLIALPKFSETGEIVLLDLETLKCEVLTFKLASDRSP